MKVIIPRDVSAHKHNVEVEGPATFRKDMLTSLFKQKKATEFYVLQTKGECARVWSCLLLLARVLVVA
jgi:hypothetical protein